MEQPNVTDKSKLLTELFGRRLKSARKMAGFSLQELSDRMKNPVSKQAIQKYEKGVMMPDSSSLLSLSKALEVRPDYFFREPIELRSVEFRKKSTLGVKEQERIKAMASDFVERYHELEACLGIDTPFHNPLEGITIKSDKDIESAAEALRKNWMLGNDPIPDVIEMLEGYGVRVLMMQTHNEFDGLSAMAGNTPVIVLNKKRDTVRKRLTALHEFAHLVLTFKGVSDKDKEKLSHAFAGAVLFPKTSFINAFGPKRMHFVENELWAMKAYYGISVQAIMARAKRLGVISESTYRHFCMNWSRYRKEEPGEYDSKETPGRFRQLLSRAVAEEIISMSKAAELAKEPLEELEKEMTFI